MDVPNDLKNLTDDEIRDLGRLDTSPGIQLDQESFDTAQELVKGAEAIGQMRQDLKDLEETRSEYILSREKEAIDAVLALIQRSQDALAQVDKNHDALREIISRILGMAERVRQMRDDIITTFDEFRLSTESIMETLNKRGILLANQEKANEAEAQRLSDLKDELMDRESVIVKDEEAVADARRTLQRGFDELQAKTAEADKTT